MKGKVAAIGTFDGVHRGHRAVLKTLAQYAASNDMEPIAITFSRHPLALIDPRRTPRELTPLWKKKKLLREAGVMPVVLEFDENLRATTAREWIKQMRDQFNVKALVVGYDNTFGSDGLNFQVEQYKQIGEEEGVEVIEAEEIKGVSSSAIRKAVQRGEMEEVQNMLGRPYSITTKVIKGNRLGRTIGFPTANVSLPEGQAMPKPGVYAGIVKTLHDGGKYPAMINIGTRPTVMRGDETVIEAHIIDWKGDLYDKEITVRFLKRLRDEEKFDTIDALKRRLVTDRKETLEIVNNKIKISVQSLH